MDEFTSVWKFDFKHRLNIFKLLMNQSQKKKKQLCTMSSQIVHSNNYNNISLSLLTGTLCREVLKIYYPALRDDHISQTLVKELGRKAM